MSGVSSEYLKDESRQCGQAEKLLFLQQCEELWDIIHTGEQVTVQGSRTGISGACIPRGGTVLNLSRMKGILKRGEDENGRYLDVLPGTTLEEIDREAGENYFFPPDPTEKTASIGGMLATNAAGPAALRYGTTAKYISEADVLFPAFGWMTVKRGEYIFSDNGELILANGKKLQISDISEADNRAIRQLTPTAGMDLLDLLAGSEGMLGIFGRIRIRLCPRPSGRWSLLCFFREEKNALIFSERILKAAQEWKDTELAADDFLDRNSLSCYREFAAQSAQYARIPDVPEEHCAVMLDVAGNDQGYMEDVLEQILILLEECGGSDENTWAADLEEEREKIRLLRHAVPECINAKIDRIRRVYPEFTKLSVDAACPKISAAQFLSELREHTDVKCTATIHRGRNIYHIDFLPDTKEQISEAKERRRTIFAYMARHDGVLAAENGIGKGKGGLFKEYLSEEQTRIMRQVKNFFDPNHQLNVGNIWE